MEHQKIKKYLRKFKKYDVQELHFRTLVLLLYCYCRHLFQITYFKETKNMAAEKNLRVTTDFYKKQCSPVITWNKKTFIAANCTSKI